MDDANVAVVTVGGRRRRSLSAANADDLKKFGELKAKADASHEQSRNNSCYVSTDSCASVEIKISSVDGDMDDVSNWKPPHALLSKSNQNHVLFSNASMTWCYLRFSFFSESSSLRYSAQR